ncbi:hypothetical protein VTH06DRAFT_3431 [Thermothelomyces fergusii]
MARGRVCSLTAGRSFVGQWFRSRRLISSRDAAPHLRAIEELAAGVAAGACAKLLTTPVGNIVTRRQTVGVFESKRNDSKNGSYNDYYYYHDDNNSDDDDSSSSCSSSSSSSDGGNETTTKRDRDLLKSITGLRKEGGLLGLWRGYSASVVLSLNPSITVSLEQALKGMLVPRERWDDPGAGTIFLLAAVSKAAATAMTYPFQTAKERGGRKVNGNIFAAVLSVARAEGGGALYDGIAGELLKAFFSHGMAMLSKDVVHRLIVRLYLAILGTLRHNSQLKGLRLPEMLRRAREEARRRYLEASSMGESRIRQGARYVQSVVGSGQNVPASLLAFVKKAS